MISILLIGSLRSPPPFRLRRTSPYSGGRINRSMLSCRDMAPWLSIHSPTTKWGKGGGASHQRGMHFRRPQGGCTVFAAKGGIRNGARKRRTSPAQRYYITPEGGSPEPACKAKPITGRTLSAQGVSSAAGSTLTPQASQPSGLQVSTVVPQQCLNSASTVPPILSRKFH